MEKVKNISKNKFLYKNVKLSVKKGPFIKCRQPLITVRPNGIVVKDSKKPFFMIIDKRRL